LALGDTLMTRTRKRRQHVPKLGVSDGEAPHSPRTTELTALLPLVVKQPLSHRPRRVASQDARTKPLQNSVLLCWRVRRASVNGIPLGSDKDKGSESLAVEMICDISFKINEF
jgi:hypothetical protein